MDIIGGVKAWAVDHIIAGSLKGAAEGKYGPQIQKLYWLIEKNAVPISGALGAIEAFVAYGCRYPHWQWACAVDTGLGAPVVIGVLGLLGVTVGVHAQPAPTKG